jgi:hypothetical protein
MNVHLISWGCQEEKMKAQNFFFRFSEWPIQMKARPCQGNISKIKISPKNETNAFWRQSDLPLKMFARSARIFLKIRATKCLQDELASPSGKHFKEKMP